MGIEIHRLKYKKADAIIFNERLIMPRSKRLFLIAVFIIIFGSSKGYCYTDAQAIRAVIGEASNQGYKGMLVVACGIRNRGTLQGVYGLNARHIYTEPKWVWEMAKKAWTESLINRIHKGTSWENIKAFGTPLWVKGMTEVYRYKDHIFYKERK